MDKFDIWVKSCDETGSEIWQLAGKVRGTGLYMTRKKYMANYKDYYTDPVFHVWKDGKIWKTTMNRSEAFQMWNREVA